MTKLSLKTAVLFFLSLFAVVTITSILTMALTLLLFRMELISPESRPIFNALPVVVSIIVGTATSTALVKRPLRAIGEISRATQAVAGGNFNVQMSTDSVLSELKEMVQNFNIMTRELANTEMLRSDFIANVSHEFKTPLAAIEGYAMLLQQKELSEEKRMEYTSRILHNSQRLSALTGNILLLSKLENQETEVERERYCLDEQLRKIILLFEEQWTAKELELEVDLDSADYMGNQELLGQVWQNILSNAIKFAPQRGFVRVLLRRKGDALRVSVSDNGPGMSGDVQRRVFEKFYQGDSSRAASGNGLGLALAKRIVDLHGGEISVLSREGEGSTFTVQLKM